MDKVNIFREYCKLDCELFEHFFKLFTSNMKPIIYTDVQFLKVVQEILF
jgi:hypothetical protein